MNIAIVSYCGLVGKTCLGANLFYPRMPEPVYIAVETVNETAAKLGIPSEVITGNDFISLYKRLPKMQNGIIDVGLTNLEAFMRGLVRFEGSHEDIDFFVVPVTPESRAQIETIKTLNVLRELEIPAEKIRLVFNKVDSDVKEEFTPVLNYIKMNRNAHANTECAVYKTELYDMLTDKRTNIATALEDTNDYRAMMRELDEKADPKKFNHYSDMRAIKALAKKESANLDRVFDALFKD